MTLDMTFEGLLVSQNVQVLKAMSRIMNDLSIQVDVCMLPSRAFDLLAKRDIDLLVVDWEKDNGSLELVRAVRNSVCRRVTIAAIVDRTLGGEFAIQAGAHAVVEKPLLSESLWDFRNLVYSRMVTERRQQPRHGVRWLVAAKDVNNKPVPVTLTDISDAGIGLLFTGELAAGDLLKFQLLLPGTNHVIQFQARVVWTVRGNIAGAEFKDIPVADSKVLHTWLQQQHQVKPLDSHRLELGL